MLGIPLLENKKGFLVSWFSVSGCWFPASGLWFLVLCFYGCMVLRLYDFMVSWLDGFMVL